MHHIHLYKLGGLIRRCTEVKKENDTLAASVCAMRWRWCCGFVRCIVPSRCNGRSEFYVRSDVSHVESIKQVWNSHWSSLLFEDHRARLTTWKVSSFLFFRIIFFRSTFVGFYIIRIRNRSNYCLQIVS